MNDKFMTVKTICEYLGVNDSLIYGLIKKGELPSIKLGSKILVKEADLNEFLKKNTKSNNAGEDSKEINDSKEEKKSDVIKHAKYRYVNLKVSEECADEFKKYCKNACIPYSYAFEQMVGILCK